MSSEHDTCPHCGVSLIGEPIPAEHQHHYGGATHGKREIGGRVDRFDKAFRAGKHHLRGGHYPVRGVCGACQDGRPADCSGWCVNYITGKT